VSPAFDAGWESTANGDRIQAVTTRISSTMTTKNNADATATALRDVLARQYIAGPFGAFSYATSQTVKGQVRTQEGGTSNDLRTQLIIRVFAANGSTDLGKILDYDASTEASNPANEWSASLTNRQCPRAGVVSLAANISAPNGHYLAFEIGYRKHAAQATGTANMSFGDDSGTDLPADETTTTANNPWIELSGTLGAAVTVFPMPQTIWIL
jgi:hypothetical protein